MALEAGTGKENKPEIHLFVTPGPSVAEYGSMFLRLFCTPVVPPGVGGVPSNGLIVQGVRYDRAQVKPKP